jgi:hypothetical protein
MSAKALSLAPKAIQAIRFVFDDGGGGRLEKVEYERREISWVF